MKKYNYPLKFYTVGNHDWNIYSIKATDKNIWYTPYMKSKNIKFEKCSEKDDAIYLRKNNNYFDKIIAKKYKENLGQKIF